MIKQFPRKFNLLFLEHPFSVVPAVDFRYSLMHIRCFFLPGNPMDGGQQFQTEGRFKSVYQLCHLLKASLSFGVIFQKGFGLFGGVKIQFDLFARIVFGVAITADEMAFDSDENVAQIFSIRPWPSSFATYDDLLFTPKPPDSVAQP